jgi:hypothetical protein
MRAARSCPVSPRRCLRTCRALCLALVVGAQLACPGRVSLPPGEGEGEGEGEAGPLDPDQIRLGTARAALADGPPVPPTALPVLPAQMVAVDLGDVQTDSRGRTGTIEIDVDDRIQALLVYVYGAPEPDNHVIVAEAVAPDGQLVIADTAPDPQSPGFAQRRNLSRGFVSQFDSAGRVLPARGQGVFPVPSTPDIPLGRGTWRLRIAQAVVQTDTGGLTGLVPVQRPVRVVVVVRQHVDRGGAALPVSLWFTGAAGLSASSLNATPALDEAVERLAGVFADVGIEVGPIAAFDLQEGAARAVVPLAEPLCDGPALDALVAGGTADALNVFFIDRFECGVFSPFLVGLAPSLPGLNFVSGVPGRGVVVAAGLLEDEPDLLATVLAHEAGHALGLFHTLENDRFGGAPIFDNIADTLPEAVRDNLMYFAADQIRAEVLTAGQGTAVRRGPGVTP